MSHPTVADTIGHDPGEPTWPQTVNSLFTHGGTYLAVVLSAITGDPMTPLQTLRAQPWNRDGRRWHKTDLHDRTLIVHGDGLWVVRGPDLVPGTRQRVEHASGVEKSVAVGKARAERWAVDHPPRREKS